MGMLSEREEGGKVLHALLGKSGIKTRRRRRRRRKMADRGGEESICSVNSLLDMTIDEETDRELMGMMSSSESDSYTVPSMPLRRSDSNSGLILPVDHHSLDDENEMDEPCLIVSPSISGRDQEAAEKKVIFNEGYLSHLISNAANSSSPLSVCSSSVSSILQMTSSGASPPKQPDLSDGISDSGFGNAQEGKMHHLTSDSSEEEGKRWGLSSSLRRKRIVRSSSMPARRRSQVTPVSSDNDEGSRTSNDFSIQSLERPKKYSMWRNDILDHSIHSTINDINEFQSSDSYEATEKNGSDTIRRMQTLRRKSSESVSSGARSARIRRLQMQGSSRSLSFTRDSAPQHRSRRKKQIMVYVDGGGVSSGPEEVSV